MHFESGIIRVKRTRWKYNIDKRTMFYWAGLYHGQLTSGHEPPRIHVEAGEWYAKYWLSPVSLAASHKRSNWRFIGGGVGVHWPDLCKVEYYAK